MAGMGQGQGPLPPQGQEVAELLGHRSPSPQERSQGIVQSRDPAVFSYEVPGPGTPPEEMVANILGAPVPPQMMEILEQDSRLPAIAHRLRGPNRQAAAQIKDALLEIQGSLNAGGDPRYFIHLLEKALGTKAL